MPILLSEFSLFLFFSFPLRVPQRQNYFYVWLLVYIQQSSDERYKNATKFGEMSIETMRTDGKILIKKASAIGHRLQKQNDALKQMLPPSLGAAAS